MPPLPAAALLMRLSHVLLTFSSCCLSTPSSLCPVLTHRNPIQRPAASCIHTHHTAITHLKAGGVYGSIEYRRLEHSPVCFNTSIHLSSRSARSPYFQPSFGLLSVEEIRSMRRRWSKESRTDAKEKNRHRVRCACSLNFSRLHGTLLTFEAKRLVLLPHPLHLY